MKKPWKITLKVLYLLTHLAYVLSFNINEGKYFFLIYWWPAKSVVPWYRTTLSPSNFSMGNIAIAWGNPIFVVKSLVESIGFFLHYTSGNQIKRWKECPYRMVEISSPIYLLT